MVRQMVFHRFPEEKLTREHRHKCKHRFTTVQVRTDDEHFGHLECQVK